MSLSADALLVAVRSYCGEMEDLLARLVAIPTENPPGQAYHACVEMLADTLASLGIDHELVNVPSVQGPGFHEYPRFCLLGRHGQEEPMLTFHGHYDVVPAVDPAQFTPYCEDGLLYSRGSADMKSGLVAMIHAVRALRDCDADLHGSVGLTIVPDEETGGLGGSRYLSDAGLLGRGTVGMLTPEPTGGVVWNANRGAISLQVTVHGKPAHVGLQHEGINAFEHGMTVVEALLALKREVETRATGYSIEPEEARRSILMLGGRSEGGTGFNLVPDRFTFTVDRRINPEENLAEEKARLLDLFEEARAGGIECDVEILQEAEASGVPEENPLARTLARSVEEVTGQRPRFEMCPGLLEIRFYARQGAPALAYGPGLLSVSHGPREYVEIEEMVRCAAVYARAAAGMLAPS